MDQIEKDRGRKGQPQKTGGCKSIQTAMEDVMCGYCLQLQHVAPYDTRDSTGAERFHLLSPAHTLQLRYNSSSSSGGEGWITEYTAKFQPKDGLSGISPSTVSFHYVGHEEQRVLSTLLYDCNRRA